MIYGHLKIILILIETNCHKIFNPKMSQVFINIFNVYAIWFDLLCTILNGQGTFLTVNQIKSWLKKWNIFFWGDDAKYDKINKLIKLYLQILNILEFSGTV